MIKQYVTVHNITGPLVQVTVHTGVVMQRRSNSVNTRIDLVGDSREPSTSDDEDERYKSNDARVTRYLVCNLDSFYPGFRCRCTSLLCEHIDYPYRMIQG